MPTHKSHNHYGIIRYKILCAESVFTSAFTKQQPHKTRSSRYFSVNVQALSTSQLFQTIHYQPCLLTDWDLLLILHTQNIMDDDEVLEFLEREVQKHTQELAVASPNGRRSSGRKKFHRRIGLDGSRHGKSRATGIPVDELMIPSHSYRSSPSRSSTSTSNRRRRILDSSSDVSILPPPPVSPDLFSSPSPHVKSIMSVKKDVFGTDLLEINIWED
jgi:hypothetical protein